MTLDNGAVTEYTYNTQGAKTAQRDALGRTTTFTYNQTGQLKSETLPLGQSKSYTYDTYGKETNVNDYAGKDTTYTYDTNDRLITTTYADGTTATYTYTKGGAVKTATDAQGTITYTYDNRGRTKKVDNHDGSFVSYTYDNNGNITSVQTQDSTITKTYDVLNRLKTVTDAQGTTTYTYDEVGNQTGVTLPNGVTTNYAFDSLNRVTAIAHLNSIGTTLGRFEYTYDNAGNKKQVVELSGRTIDYTYDNVNRLTGETITNDPNGINTTTTYTYDLVGNLITKTVDGVTTTYTYNKNDQLINQGSSTFTYDDNGNLISKDATTYDYDDLNRLITLTTPTSIIDYTYDVNNNRIAKTVDGVTTNYLVDTNTPYAQVLKENNSTDTISYTYGNDLLSQSTSNGDYYFHTDALGSTRSLTDGSGVATDSFTYTPYGKLIDHTGSTDTNYLYTGEQLDSETDNYYLRARYYDPSSSRFMAIDPYEGRMAEPNTLNDYIYAGGNPVMFTDPSGEFYSMAEVGLAINMVSYIRTSITTSFVVRAGAFYGMRAIVNLNNFILGGSVVTYGVKNRATWGFWNDLPKVIYRGTKYAYVRGFYYTEHAVQRMTPIVFGARHGRTDAGRGIPSMAVEYTVTFGKTLSKELVNGGIRYTKVYGDIFVAFEKSTTGRIIIVSVRKASGGK